MSNNSNVFESNGWLFRPLNEALHRANLLYGRAKDDGNDDLANHFEQYMQDLTKAYFKLIDTKH